MLQPTSDGGEPISRRELIESNGRVSPREEPAPSPGWWSYVVWIPVALDGLDRYLYDSGLSPVPAPIFFLVVGLLVWSRFAGRQYGPSRPRVDEHSQTVVDTRWVLLAIFLAALIVVGMSTTIGLPDSPIRQAAWTAAHLAAKFIATSALAWSLLRHRIESLLSAYRRISALISGLACIQALALFTGGWLVSIDPLLGVHERGGRIAQPEATMSEPAFLGYFLFHGLLIEPSRQRDRVRDSIDLLLILGILSTSSLGPIVLVLAWLGWRVWRELPVGRVPAITTLLLFFLAGGAFAYTVNAGGEDSFARASPEARIESIIAGRDPSAISRREMLESSFELFSRQPLTGTGLGSTRYYIGDLYDPTGTGLSGAPGYSAANAYVSFLGETGLVGLGALMAFLYVAWRKGAGTRSGSRVVGWHYAEFLLIGTFFAPSLWVWYAVSWSAQDGSAHISSGTHEHEAVPALLGTG